VLHPDSEFFRYFVDPSGKRDLDAQAPKTPSPPAR
jgi:hypothetical protein